MLLDRVTQNGLLVEKAMHCGSINCQASYWISPGQSGGALLGRQAEKRVPRGRREGRMTCPVSLNYCDVRMTAMMSPKARDCVVFFVLTGE